MNVFFSVVTNLQQLANDGRIKQITWTVGYCLYTVRLSFIAVTRLYDRYTIFLSGTNSFLIVHVALLFFIVLLNRS